VTGAPRKPDDGYGMWGFRDRNERNVAVTAVGGLALFSYVDLLGLGGEHVVFTPTIFSVVLILLLAFRCAPLLWFRRSPERAFAAVLAGNALSAAVFAPAANHYSLWPWSLSGQASILATLAAAGLVAGRRRTV